MRRRLHNRRQLHCRNAPSPAATSSLPIGEAIAENGRVIVTGCMGEEAGAIRAAHPQVLAVTGAHQYEQVVDAVHTHLVSDNCCFVVVKNSAK